MKNPILLWILLLSLVGSACEPVSPSVTPRQERSHVRFFNAYYQAPINVRMQTFGETRFLQDRIMPYHAWPQGSYASLVPRTITSDTALISRDSLRFDVRDYEVDTLLVEGYRETLARGTYASFYVVDSMGKAIMIKTSDQFGQLRGNQAAYRFINLYPLFSTVDLQSSNQNDSLDFTFSLEFLGYSGFKQVEAGRRSLYAINKRSQAVIDSLPQVDLKPGGVYVFYLLSRNGFPMFDYERIN